MSEIIGIVTVLYNSNEVLPDFFSSLASQTNINYKLYVIDNSPNNSGSVLSKELAASHNIKSEIIFNNENVGVARGNNQGIKLAQKDNCKYIVLSNNDIEFKDANLISSMVELSKKRSNSAVVPKIYYHSAPDKIWFAGGDFSLYKATTPHYGDGEFDHGQYDQENFINYAPTCFMLLPIEVFDEIGYMDERYFVYYDDSDFVWRMKQKKLKLYYWPKGRVWHKVSTSTGGGDSEFSLFYNFRNRIFFINKNYHLHLKIIAYSYILSTLPIKYFKFNKKQYKAIISGLKDGLKIK